MLSEYDIVLHVNDVHGIVRVVVFEVLEDLELDTGLIVVLLLVLDDLKGDVLLAFVVEALECDAEGALAEELLYLVPVADVVPHHDLIVALVVVIAEVVLALQGPLDLLAALPNVVDLGVVQDLLQLEGRQGLLQVLDGLRGRQRELQVLQPIY